MTPVLSGSWNYPTKVWHGPGQITGIAKACQMAGIARPLLVTDSGLAESGIVIRVMQLLELGGFAGVALFSGVKGNPTGGNVDAGLAAFRAGSCDGVIAVGGGSALDIGKCIAFMAGQSRPIWDFEDVGDAWTRASQTGIAPIIAVPTTAGTGSEVGRAAVVTNEASHEKKIIFHPMMLPRLAICDPELTVGLPPKLTAWTGMDALAHCIEAYCAPGFHPMADGIAVEGVRLIADHLPTAVRDGHDLEARSRMLAAASMGAAAFQKGLGAVHSISHPVGAIYDTHHGLTNGVVLPYVLTFNRPAIEERMAYLAVALGLPGGDFDALIEWLLAFRASLYVPHSLGELGVQEARVGELAEKAMRDPSTGGNPITMTVEDFRRVIMSAIHGDLTLGA
jgi:alcohol dehydrogenase class IV